MSVPAPAPPPLLLVDTDVLIEMQRGNAAAVAWFKSLKTIPSVPGLVTMEILEGARDKTEMQQLQRFLRPLPVVWPTEADGAVAVSLFTTYKLSHGIGLIDSLIAATALGLGAELCTRNQKHYQMVPGLTLKKPF